MLGPLLLSFAAVVPVLSSIISSSQDSQLMNLLANTERVPQLRAPRRTQQWSSTWSQSSSVSVPPRKRRRAWFIPLLQYRSSRTASEGYPEWILQPSKAVKKYDRNCFFSPVQCMLGFNQVAEDPIVFTSKIKRLFLVRK